MARGVAQFPHVSKVLFHQVICACIQYKSPIMHLLVIFFPFHSQTYTNLGQTSRVRCPPLHKLLNGYQRHALDTVGGAEAIEFFCKNSYILSGNHQSTCLSNGSWSSSPPKCVKGSCFQKHFTVGNTLLHTHSSLFSHSITMCTQCF